MLRLVILFFLFNLSTANALTEIKLCYEDVVVFPWITGEESGLAITEIKQIEKNLNLKIKLIRLPWKRCQLEALAGKVDGLIAASFTDERNNWGAFPFSKNGKLDRRLRLHSDGYLVFVRKDSKVHWKNKKFSNLGKDPIGVQLGYSAGSDLEKAGYNVHSSFSTTQEIFEALQRNELKVAVVQKYSTIKIISDNPSLADNLVKMKEPFKEMDQYLMFTKAFYLQNEKLCKKIWNAIPAARMSPEYAILEKSLLSNGSPITIRE